ncbi:MULTISPECIES: amino acid adenylation domain-containing protein [unclassified Streptomyces]|uniref:amino acid adenylation domain-containing protein n=1 Tax=unclassified Streptomyces TaxID=2593676 RepID=UPI0009324B91|nr:amino acid adenylation domain-containing protein [Streptomyces sp. NBRC 110465]
MSEPGGASPLIHSAFSRHAAERPDAPALLVDGSAISYETLDAASDAYAELLAAHGAGPGQIVPLVLPRSAQLVALELAALKCGAAYANIDPDWPAERRAAIFAQTAPKVVVTGAATEVEADAAILRVGPEALDETAARTSAFTPVPVTAADPATVFFTSGTTGRPKGVVVPHRAVTRLFGPHGLEGFGPGHVTPQAAATAWDMYAFELWGQLSTGGCAALVQQGHLLPNTLRELITTVGVDTVWLTTSLFNLFVDEDVDCFTGVRQMLIGGEKLSPRHVRTFLERHPSIPLRNGYGPVENCMLTTTHLIRPQDCDVPEGIPVGQVVPGTTVLILSPEGTPRAAGETGEVCVAGTGLAVHYLDEPEMTAEKFPTVEIGGSSVRIYRTGDFGLVDDKGVLQFRGRRDRQVKISGYRVELAEIENAARRIEGVRECIVVPLGAPDGEVTALALCYVAQPADGSVDGAPQGERELRKELSLLLPDYLVPRVIRRLDRFPVTANGKADQAELRRIAASARRGRP